MIICSSEREICASSGKGEWPGACHVFIFRDLNVWKCNVHVEDARRQDHGAGIGKRGEYEVGRVEQLSSVWHRNTDMIQVKPLSGGPLFTDSEHKEWIAHYDELHYWWNVVEVVERIFTSFLDFKGFWIETIVVTLTYC